MRIGVSLTGPQGPGALSGLRDQLRRAADEGFASAWMSQLFGLDTLTALAIASSGVAGIEVGTAVVPTYPRHPAVPEGAAAPADVAIVGDEDSVAGQVMALAEGEPPTSSASSSAAAAKRSAPALC